MSTNGINEAFNAGFKVKLQNRGAKSSGITFELKSVFDEMAKQGLIKDTDGKGLTKQDALNLYAKLNEMHQQTNRATNYTRMQAGQEFSYTADEMKALAQAAGYEVVEPAKPEIKQGTAPVISQKIQETIDKSLKPSIKSSDIAKPEVAATEGKVELLEQALADNKQARREIRQELREARREARIERREDRRAERAERREARHSGELKAEKPAKPVVTEPANDPKYENARLSLVEEDFNENGQVGKISQGKYYINGTEVSKEVYEVAKTRATSQVEAVTDNNIKPFTREQIINIKDDLYKRAVLAPVYDLDDGSVEIAGIQGYIESIVRHQVDKKGLEMKHNCNIYKYLVKKEESGVLLTEDEKQFMVDFEKEIAEFYYNTEPVQ